MNASSHPLPPRATRSRGHSREAAAARTAPLVLWRIAEAFMHTLYMLFGNPEDVAGHGAYVKHTYQRMSKWLHVAEALLRRLLLIEASAMPQIYAPPARKPRRAHVRKLREFSADKPETWRVSFRCFLRDDSRLGDTHARLALRQDFATLSRACVSSKKTPKRRRTPKRFFKTWPLAERYEAVLRVFNDPAAFARRLAKRLGAQPHRRAEVMRAPNDAPHKIGDTAWAQLASHCEQPRPPSDSS